MIRETRGPDAETPPQRHSSQRHDPGGWGRHAHASTHRFDAQAAGAGGRQGVDQPRARSPRRGRGRDRRGQRPPLRRPDRAAPQAGGGAAEALPLLGTAPFFHVNSDTLWIDGVKPNLERLATAFEPDKMDALLLLAPTATSVGYAGRGDFSMAPDGRLRRRAEREVVPFVYAGIAILSPALFRDAPSGAFPLTRLFDHAIEEERLFGLRLEGVWMHVGSPDAVAAAEAAILASAA